MFTEGSAEVYFAPRGVGPTAWPEAKDKPVRRRFNLLGQTLDGMRAYDVRRAVAAVEQIDFLREATIELVGTGQAAPGVVLASLFEPGVTRIRLAAPPTTAEDGPSFLNLSSRLGLPQLVGMMHPREVDITTEEPGFWRWSSDLGARLQPGSAWPEIRTPRVP